MLQGEDFFKDKSDDFSSGGGSSPFNSAQTERVPMISKIFNEVLGREPSSREMAYYKYGVLKEDGIRTKLLKSEEHKQLLEKALRLPGVEEELKSVRVSERKLQQKMEDTNQEILESKRLLEQKNNLINELREKMQNPYDIPSQIEKFQEGFDVYTIKRNREPKAIKKEKGFKEKLIDLINNLF